ncbi:K(+)-transporting ATPase subunit F [Brasilonema bromeliae SPC951]|uniref:K(+)-transporting ATPase subunit F n=1 Tax=Brasilonema bromeliae SPC951 TaxID=385972 RepID=A0ABX1P438_9CYAN|nr:K(+)-transporting ATPase subunit F [Brasilonema bromeliae SPC951]
MKKNVLSSKFFLTNVPEAISFVWLQWRSQKLPLAIFVALCLNLLIAPIVYAAGDGTLERLSAWAIGVLGFITLAIILYLSVVVFQPERF